MENFSNAGDDQGLQREFIKKQGLLIVKGFCMGMADVIPGVSGGTMAFILGIYTELIAAIRSFDLVWLKALVRFNLQQIISRPHFYFLIPLLLGIISALMFFTRVISLPEMLLIHPEEIYGLFFGLIGGSIIILVREMKGLGPVDVVVSLIGIGFGLYIFHFAPINTPETAWFTFLSGALAICAMILPGISGSFILLILNKYTYLFNAIGYMQFSILIPFALGAIAGLVLFSRILSYLLSRYYRATVMSICGILVASLTVIWPFQERVYETVRGKSRLIESTPLFPEALTQSVFISICLVFAGFALVLTMHQLALVKARR